MRTQAAAIPLLIAFLAGMAVAQAERAENPLVFSYFKGNGEDGLHLAWSRDGLKFTPLKNDKPFLAPGVGQKEKLMRDPCIVQGPDGVFHLVWTVGWREPKVIGYASSRDLIEWSQPRAIPVMEHEPNARNCWAPELFYDQAREEFLIFWSTTIPGRFAATDTTGDDGWNHRIYYTKTKDFQAFTPTKLLFDGGFNVIDATMVRFDGKYHLIVKDETRRPEPKKNLRIATSDSAEGPWSKASDPFTINWVEGPSIARVGERFIIYFDHYSSPQYYGAVTSTDLKNWTDITKQISFPKGARHGTVFPVSQSILQRLLDLP